MPSVVALTKAHHVKGYSKGDGTYVQPHIRRDSNKGKPKNPDAVHHPKLGEDGDHVVIHKPSHPSSHTTWHNPDAVATFTPGGDFPLSLNGVPLAPWRDAPSTTEGWDYADGINEDLEEPAFTLSPGKKAAAGVVIEEPDGRVWIIAPTNAFGGYKASFPKGTAEQELSLQGNALKECWEEAGLKVEITGFIGDFDRSTSKARMYRARRVGGSPVDMGWESQAVHLVPKGKLYDYLNMPGDHGPAEAVGAGPAPKPKPKPYKAKPAPTPASKEGGTGSLF